MHNNNKVIHKPTQWYLQYNSGDSDNDSEGNDDGGGDGVVCGDPLGIQWSLLQK